jgi:hypothetical protein
MAVHGPSVLQVYYLYTTAKFHRAVIDHGNLKRLVGCLSVESDFCLSVGLKMGLNTSFKRKLAASIY